MLILTDVCVSFVVCRPNHSVPERKLWFNEKHGSIRSQTFMWWIIHKNSLIFSFVSPAIILYCRRKVFIWRLVCPPQMPPSSLQQLVFQPSTAWWSLTGPHWHFDQQTMRCFDFPLIWQSGCTVSPPEAHLARWHELRIGISRLSFSADGWQSCPNAAEVVIFSFQIVVSDLWPSFFFFFFFFFFFLPLEAQTCQTVMCEPHSGVSFCQQPRHTHTAGSGRKKNASD